MELATKKKKTFEQSANHPNDVMPLIKEHPDGGQCDEGGNKILGIPSNPKTISTMLHASIIRPKA